MERFGEFDGGGDDGGWDIRGAGGERCVIGIMEDRADGMGLLQIRRLKSVESAVTGGMEERDGLETRYAVLRQWSLLDSIIASCAFMDIGIRSRMGPESQVHLAGAKNYSGSEFLHCIIQCQLDSAMILYSAQFGPRGSLARQLGVEHELGRWIREHTGKIGV